MRILAIIFMLLQLTAASQDRVFMKNGKVLKGVFVSVADETVYFKNSDTSQLQHLKKQDILLIDLERGTRYIFGQEAFEVPDLKGEKNHKRNSVGMQPLNIFTGRITVVYERLSKNGKVGFVFPLSLAFDPSGSLFEEDSTATTERIEGVKLITGLDLNFYLSEKERSRFFIGPRIRFGTDPFLSSVQGFPIQGYTIQTQIGWRFGRPGRFGSQHFSVGFGIARLTLPAGFNLPVDQFYGWYSINYRLSLNW